MKFLIYLKFKYRGINPKDRSSKAAFPLGRLLVDPHLLIHRCVSCGLLAPVGTLGTLQLLVGKQWKEKEKKEGKGQREEEGKPFT